MIDFDLERKKEWTNLSFDLIISKVKAHLPGSINSRLEVDIFWLFLSMRDDYNQYESYKDKEPIRQYRTFLVERTRLLVKEVKKSGMPLGCDGARIT
jgi:hypothetical protein